jgi:ferredoxin-NADP reductase
LTDLRKDRSDADDHQTPMGRTPLGTPMKVSLQLIARRAEGENVISCLFQSDPPLWYQAGQHVRLTIDHADPDTRGTSRFFTISSSSSEPQVMITTRLSEQGSTFKRALSSLASGSVVEAVGPFGRFVYPPDHPPALFIAGGIGITPFRSILVDLATRLEDPDVVLLYANRTADIPFRAHLDDLAATRPGLNVHYTVTRPSSGWHGQLGRIDRAFIESTVPDLGRRIAYVSGPRPMVEAIVSALTELGADLTRIKQEVFPGYES